MKKDYTTLTISINLHKTNDAPPEVYQGRLNKIAALSGKSKSDLVKGWIDGVSRRMAESAGVGSIEDIVYKADV